MRGEMMPVTVDRNQLVAAQLMLTGVKNGLPKVQARAVNKALAKALTASSKEIGATVNLKAARIKKDFTQVKANYADPGGKIVCKGGPVGLINYGARQVRNGVSVQVLKSKPRTILKHAYIATYRGTQHVFWRSYEGPRAPFNPKTKYGKLPVEFRKPVERLTGPRIPDIFDRDEVMKIVLEVSADSYQQNFYHELERELERLR
jgi:hypothetical protein